MPLIKYLYLIRTKSKIYVCKEKWIRISKLSAREIIYYILGYTKSIKIHGKYKHQNCRVLTSWDVVFPEFKKHLESNQIESSANLPIDLDF
jgi:hypothetical protein